MGVFIKIGEKYIGLQVCPDRYPYITEITKELANETKFTEKSGEKVFYIISMKKEGEKTIYNTEVIEKIKQEIKALHDIAKLRSRHSFFLI
ncbi:MAG: hypothetical protein QXF52_02520 [Thermoproteota archaeon]